MEIRKTRSDIALTLGLTRAIVARLETGLPLIKRSSPHILLDDQKWVNKVPVGTYNSWRTRNTAPVDSSENKGFDEILTENRNRINDERRERFLRLGEKGIDKILRMSLVQKTTEKRINKSGEYERRIIEKINPSVVSAKLKVTNFALERLHAGKYGRHTNARKKVSTFSLAQLRKVKDESK